MRRSFCALAGLDACQGHGRSFGLAVQVLPVRGVVDERPWGLTGTPTKQQAIPIRCFRVIECRCRVKLLYSNCAPISVVACVLVAHQYATASATVRPALSRMNARMGPSNWNVGPMWQDEGGSQRLAAALALGYDGAHCQVVSKLGAVGRRIVVVAGSGRPSSAAAMRWDRSSLPPAALTPMSRANAASSERSQYHRRSSSPVIPRLEFGATLLRHTAGYGSIPLAYNPLSMRRLVPRPLSRPAGIMAGYC